MAIYLIVLLFLIHLYYLFEGSSYTIKFLLKIKSIPEIQNLLMLLSYNKYFLKSSSVLFGTSFNKPYIIKIKIALIIHDFFKRQK